MKNKSKITGQASLEYFLAFAAIGVLGIISLSSFLPRVREALYDQNSNAHYVRKVTDAIINADIP